MSEISIPRDLRLELRSQAHHLDPVVLLGAQGLTEAVLKEIDRALTAHELIKIRVPSDDREEREEIFHTVLNELNAARVQTIGKLLILWRPCEQAPEDDATLIRKVAKSRQTITDTVASKKKVATQKPGQKKKKAAPVARVRRRPKRQRTTKKAALS